MTAGDSEVIVPIARPVIRGPVMIRIPGRPVLPRRVKGLGRPRGSVRRAEGRRIDHRVPTAPNPRGLVEYYSGNSTNREVAQLLDCPVGTIKGASSRLARCFRERLSRAVPDLDGVADLVCSSLA